MDLLAQTISDFEQWRNTRAAREQTPSRLRRQVASLTNSYTKAELCQALNVNNRLIERCLQEYQANEILELPELNERTEGELRVEISIQGINAAIKGLPQDIASMILCLGSVQ